MYIQVTCLKEKIVTIIYIFSTQLNDDNIFPSTSGLGFRPMPPEANVESTLVWYESSKKDNYKYWVDETSRFLKCK